MVKVLGVIPARMGSKRVERKNIKPFRGRPLIEWTLLAAADAELIDLLVVSTDDPEVKRIAKVYADEVIDRPPELATDDASSEDVLRHALSLYPAEWVVLLQPTSPLRTAEDIDACIERAQMGDACISYNRETGFKNGAVYVAKADWIAQHDFTHLGTMRYQMDESRSLDINTEEDFSK